MGLIVSRLFKTWLIVWAGLTGVDINAQESKVEAPFELNEVPAIVEGMTFDPVDGNFYFGESINKRILKYSKEGKSLGYIDGARDGMISILGMSVFPRTHQLWVCGAISLDGKNTMCVFEYDVKDGRLLNRYPDTSGKAGLFNDIAVTFDGAVYATDTYGRALYKMDTVNHIASLYMQNDSLRDANGIAADSNILYVSTSRGFTKVNTTNRLVTRVNLKDFMIVGNDGLYYYKNSLIAIQNVFFPVTIGRYYLNRQKTEIDKARVLSAGHPSFVIPTTGAIVDNYFYFMSNNNIGNENMPDKSTMKKITVARIFLRDNRDTVN